MGMMFFLLPNLEGFALRSGHRGVNIPSRILSPQSIMIGPRMPGFRTLKTIVSNVVLPWALITLPTLTTLEYDFQHTGWCPFIVEESDRRPQHRFHANMGAYAWPYSREHDMLGDWGHDMLNDWSWGNMFLANARTCSNIRHFTFHIDLAAVEVTGQPHTLPAYIKQLVPAMDHLQNLHIRLCPFPAREYFLPRLWSYAMLHRCLSTTPERSINSVRELVIDTAFLPAPHPHWKLAVCFVPQTILGLHYAVASAFDFPIPTSLT
jgi:hypothetical protein